MRYVGLIITVTLSFLAICQFEITFSQQDPEDILPAFWQTQLPGVIFSVYILILHARFLNIFGAILGILLLPSLYFISFYSGFISWGMGAPICGAIGSLIIGLLARYRTKAIISKATMLLIGFLSVIPGLILFYVLQPAITDGVGFGFMICLWQLLVGLALIKKLENPNESSSTDFDKQLNAYLKEEQNSK